jgi:hypothetical protein
MSFTRLLATARAGLRSAWKAERIGSEEPDSDSAEELRKVQRGLRRLSLAADRSTAILDTVAGRVDEIQQSLRELRRPGPSMAGLSETDLLRALDRLDVALEAPDLPAAARSCIQGAKDALLAAAAWQIVAPPGARPDGADIRIAELVGSEDSSRPDAGQRAVTHGNGIDANAENAAVESNVNSVGNVDMEPAEARIERVLEQGYRRADGTLLRPAVVVATRTPSRHDSP